MAAPEISIASIAEELNNRAHSFRIGDLPKIRSSLTGRRSTASAIFDFRTIKPTYAFHVGGRQGLQFNIGTDDPPESEVSELRYGIAFSLQTGRNLPTIEPLLPKIARFNEFFRHYPERFENLKMWYWQDDKRSADFPPTPIRPEWAVPPSFIFIGERQPMAALDYDAILSLFDRFLPVYKCTEGGADAQPIEAPVEKKFEFRPGFTARASRAAATLAERYLDIKLRHNDIEKQLYLRLESEHGKTNVCTEKSNGVGGLMDVAVQTPEGLWIYEIKTGTSARGCIREAIGQLLEYALWPGAPKAVKLIVVGEGTFDDAAKAYLKRLNERFPLSISYEQIVAAP